MAWKTKRLWTLLMAFVFLEHASGGGVLNKVGHHQQRGSVGDYYPVGPQAGSFAPQSQLLDSSSSSVTDVQQGSLQQWFSGSYSSDPSYPVPLPPQPQTFPQQAVDATPLPLWNLGSVGGDHTSSSSQGAYDLYTGPSLYAATAVSQGPLQKLKSRLFTSQGASVVSSGQKVASDLPQKSGTPPVPSHSMGTWQPSSSLKPDFQVGHGAPGARLDQYRPGTLVSSWPKVASDLPQKSGTPPLTVPSHSVGTWQPSSSLKPVFQVGHGAPGARLDQYSKADWTSAAYDLSQGLSSGFGVQKRVSQQKPGLPFTASGFTQPQKSSTTQPSSDWSSAAVSPSLTFSQVFSAGSLKPVQQGVSSQYDYSVKH